MKKVVQQQIEEALKLNGHAVVINGLAGKGNSEALKTWCAQRAGVARYIDLEGITTSFFHSLARALGLRKLKYGAAIALAALALRFTAPEVRAQAVTGLATEGYVTAQDESLTTNYSQVCFAGNPLSKIRLLTFDVNAD